MGDVEREIENKAREKERQAGKMPTIVLVDISRVGWADAETAITNNRLYYAA